LVEAVSKSVHLLPSKTQVVEEPSSFWDCKITPAFGL